MYRDLPSRHTIRLPGFDYSLPNWYYITICAHDRKCIFGDCVGAGSTRPRDLRPIFSHSRIGKIVQQYWEEIPQHYRYVSLDQYVVMPNHIHGIIFLKSGRENPAPTLGQIIAYFKYQTTKQYNMLVGAGFSRPFPKLWQRNYYEHIIRDEGELNHVRQYIADNPKNWEQDKLFI